jgi:hypothetical protein
MTSNSQITRIIAVLLIFILLTELYGCVSTRESIRIYDVPQRDYDPTYNGYVITAKKASGFPKFKGYLVKNISIEEGYLTADINELPQRPTNFFTIYVKSDSLIKAASDDKIIVALADICDVKVERVNWFLFWIYAGVAIVAVGCLLALFFGDEGSSS